MVKGLSYRLVRTEINGQILEYEDIFTPVVKFGTIDASEAKKLFHKTAELFDEAGIKFSLIFGTLLGAVREGGVIAGDQDIDICTWEEDKLRDNLISMQNKGLKVCRMIEGTMYSFVIDSGAYIDVYIMEHPRYFEAFPWSTYCVNIAWFYMPKKLFTGWEETEFLGVKCLRPENPERLLEFWYGSDWKIPRNKKGTYEVKSLHYLRHNLHLSILFKVLRFLFNPKYRHIILKRKKETGSFFNM